MPFPLVSHQGLAAPALLVGRGRRLDPVAYLVGTLAPDLPYALDRSRWDVDAGSHTVPGLVLWSIPIAVLASWVFRRYMARPLAAGLPDLGSLRLRDAAWASAQRAPVWWVSVLSAGLGAVTHLLFDGFVHPEDWAVALFPVLEDPAPVSLPNHPSRTTLWYDVAHAVADSLGVVLAVVCVAVAARRPAAAAGARPELPPASAEHRRLLVGAVAAGAAVGLAAAARVWWIETMAQATMLFTWSVALGTLGGCLLVRRYPATAMDASTNHEAEADTESEGTESVVVSGAADDEADETPTISLDD